jgi:hypothetical protein
MSAIFAHHLEAHHVPVLLGLFAAGLYIGWQALSRWLTRGHAPAVDPRNQGPAGRQDRV